MTDPKPRPRRYHERTEEGTSMPWTEVSPPGADPVSLSGPGPCRGMRSVPRADFERNYVKVP